MFGATIPSELTCTVTSISSSSLFTWIKLNTTIVRAVAYSQKTNKIRTRNELHNACKKIILLLILTTSMQIHSVYIGKPWKTWISPTYTPATTMLIILVSCVEIFGINFLNVVNPIFIFRYIRTKHAK